MNIVIVGTVIEKDGKYLLVQEAQASCRGKWNLPAGHLDPRESIFDGAKREAKEECGLDVELRQICHIVDKERDDDNLVGIVFSSFPISSEISFSEDEILDARWFSYEEIVAMKDRGELRDPIFVLGSIDNLLNGLVAPLELAECNS